MAEIIALGELLIDFAPEGSNSMGYPVLSANPGGAPCNFLAAAAKYGCSAGFIGKVGNDAFGRTLRKTLEDINIDTDGLVMADDVFTTLAFVTLDDSGDRNFSFARKPGADTCIGWEEIDTRQIDGCRVFHFGTLSLTDEPARSATYRAVEYAKSQGKIISCDPNYRAPLWNSEKEAKEQMLWAISKADILKISDNEVEFLWGCSPEEGLEIILERYGVSLAMVTLGPDGCIASNGKNTVAVPGIKVNAIDTTGAGDIFGGSAMSRIVKMGKPIKELDAGEIRNIVSFAAAAAGLSTEKYGGIPSVPDIDTVSARIINE